MASSGTLVNVITPLSIARIAVGAFTLVTEAIAPFPDLWYVYTMPAGLGTAMKSKGTLVSVDTRKPVALHPTGTLTSIATVCIDTL